MSQRMTAGPLPDADPPDDSVTTSEATEDARPTVAGPRTDIERLHDGHRAPEESRSDLTRRGDAELVDLARAAVARVQHGDREIQRAEMDRTRALLTEARRRGEPRLVAWMLRSAAMVRLFSADHQDSASEVIDELSAHAIRHGLTIFEAAAHGLRCRVAMTRGDESTAVTATAIALAIAEPELERARGLARKSMAGTGRGTGWPDTRRLLTGVATDISSALIQLGVHEHAAELLAGADEVIRSCGTDHEICVHLLNRLDLHTGWGLRLERVGRLSEAMTKHREAADYAREVELFWPNSLFPHRAGARAVDEIPAVGAALAIAEPGAGHIERLRTMLGRPDYPGQLISVSIALARCLDTDRRRAEAVAVLTHTIEAVDLDNAERTLRLSLARELARLAENDAVMGAWAGYANAVEFELWSLREARRATLYARLEHERLSREHGTIAAQAMQDPLTGLPNRRALDRRLAELLADGDEPHAVAMIDLDGFKAVNDRFSHAEGDSVLLAVSHTLRESLRDHDVITRYGGDEFVVLLPMTTLRGAERALARTVSAVAGLAPETGRGVTLSIGVVAVANRSGARELLAEADNAMYLAKRQGGNRVVAAGQPG